MKALRLDAYQETACYTRPFANKVTETYPLPPYSTVKGMIHAILEANELVPFELSIQGNYDTIITDYRKTYFVEKSTVNMPIIFDGLEGEMPNFPDMKSMPLYSHMLYNVNLIIHVKAELDILQNIYEAFTQLKSHVSLGRQEDLLRIDSVQFVSLEELDLFDGKRLDYSMYVPTDKVYEDELKVGIPYKLNWTYEIKNNIREWVRIPVVYFEENTFINEELIQDTAFLDHDGNIVIWNL